MAKKLLKFAFCITLAIMLLGMSLTSAAAPAPYSALPCISGIDNTVSASSWGLFSGSSPIRAVSADYSTLKLYPGGIPFGVKFMTEGVIVVGFADIKSDSGKVCPATAAGLKQNDIILKINGETVTDAIYLSDIAEKSGGASMTLTYSRNGKQAQTTLTPAFCKEEGKYKTGMYVKDSGAGIGTVTYIYPDTLNFGGLGHGICDGDTGKLIPMQRGSVVGVTISGVVKGLSGAPGEVRGYFSSGKTGTLLTNTECGVFGAFASLPSGLVSEPLPVAKKSEIKEGEAYILSTLDGTTPMKYKIQISNIKLDSTSNKCFTVTVTDSTLINKTGGIIQGMSGSPIIQNGKLVGAVTHVLVNDPTTGYGIFIENMLNAANTKILPKAA